MLPALFDPQGFLFVRTSIRARSPGWLAPAPAFQLGAWPLGRPVPPADVPLDPVRHVAFAHHAIGRSETPRQRRQP